jgi:[protein-PII] uridylyltransferase
MYATNHSDLELFNPQQFERDLQSSNLSELKVFQNALKHGHHILKERFNAYKNATDYVTQRAWLIDKILLEVWEQHATCLDHEKCALIAVGGYGRGELHPHSDVDLLFLLESEQSTTQDCLESFIRFLWDIHLEVGHSVRTLAQCQQEAAADISVVSNLIEARLLTGSESLFQAMQEGIAPEHLWPVQAFFSAKLEEKNRRELKYDNSAYNLEPNIKEGLGGLRDIHMIGWVAKRHFGAKTLYDLVQHAFLTEKEYQSLISGQEFLWEIRCLLHFTAGRNEERLLFDYQRTLANLYGYEDDDTGLAVEKLMKQYYRTIKQMSALNDMLLQLFQEAILYADSHNLVKPLNKRFQLRNGFIEVTHDKVFVNYPFALLEIFLLMQQNQEIKGIRAATIRLIIHYNYLIDDAFHKDLRARSLFIEIFRQSEGLTHALRRMNRYGILAAYIPAFGKIVGQMQYDLFHIYTVDQHVLVVVCNLRRLNLPQYEHEFPFCSELIQTIPKPELLYLAALFHDIGKGRGTDHSTFGELEALKFCQAHALSDNDARLVAWLVRHHLLMSTTVQRQDIYDPDVVKNFAQQVEDTIHLDYLYLLTVADIRATNPKLWNSWKNALLTELYKKTQIILHHGLGDVLNKQLHIQDLQKQAREGLTHDEHDNERITALWNDLGDDYFLHSSPQEVIRETQAILDYATDDNPLVLERLEAKGGTEFIMIYTQTCEDLFADTTYFLEQKNLTIVDAYIVPTQSKYIISGYTVLENGGEEIQPQERVEEILAGLKQVLSCKTRVPLTPIVRHIPRELKLFSVPTRVTFMQDHINSHTVLEVITTDRPGVLSRIAQAFVTCDVQIKKANIGTFGIRVEDIFFVTDYKNNGLCSADQLDCLREKLSELLDEKVPKTPLQKVI